MVIKRHETISSPCDRAPVRGISKISGPRARDQSARSARVPSHGAKIKQRPDMTPQRPALQRAKGQGATNGDRGQCQKRRGPRSMGRRLAPILYEDNECLVSFTCRFSVAVADECVILPPLAVQQSTSKALAQASWPIRHASMDSLPLSTPGNSHSGFIHWERRQE